MMRIFPGDAYFLINGLDPASGFQVAMCLCDSRWLCICLCDSKWLCNLPLLLIAPEILLPSLQQFYLMLNRKKIHLNYYINARYYQDTKYAVMSIHTVAEKQLFSKLMHEHPAFNQENQILTGK